MQGALTYQCGSWQHRDGDTKGSEQGAKTKVLTQDSSPHPETLKQQLSCHHVQNKRSLITHHFHISSFSVPKTCFANVYTSWHEAKQILLHRLPSIDFCAVHSPQNMHPSPRVAHQFGRTVSAALLEVPKERRGPRTQKHQSCGGLENTGQST